MVFYRVISGPSAFSLFPSTITGPNSWITNATNFLHGESLFDLFVWLCQSLMDHVLLFFLSVHIPDLQRALLSRHTYVFYG